MIRKTRRNLLLLFLIISSSLNAVGAIWLYHGHRQNLTRKYVPINETRKASMVEPRIVAEDSINILDIPKKDFDYPASNDITEDENHQALYIKNDVERTITYLNHRIEYAQFSPSHTNLGFFYLPEDSFLNKITLAVFDINKKTVTEIYQGDTWTSNWEWRGDRAVIVKRSCGTGCMNAKVIDISTGEEVDTYRVY